ncbi:MAG: hypothetical protein NC039_00795 [Muribaculaceae bacterium]|nr:hypothetical protein [Muribaculaceae bacterium]
MTRLLFLLIFYWAFLQASAVETPDFAYPKTVSEESVRNLAKALASNDGPLTVRSAMDLFMAKSMISTDSISSSLHLLDNLRSNVKSPVAASLLSLLEAEAYSQLYSRDRWKYDRRELPLSPIPGLYTEWSGLQFRTRIKQLTDSAIMDIPGLMNTPISAWKDVIVVDHETEIYYPSMFVFVARKVIDILGDMNIRNSGNDKAEILRLYDSLLHSCSPGTAPYISAQLGKMQFLGQNSFKEMMSFYNGYTSAATGSPTSEYAGDILCDIGMPEIGSLESRLLYTTIKDFLKSYPDFRRKGCLKNQISNLSAQSVNVEAPQLTGPGRDNQIRVTLTNVAEARIMIYNVSSTSSKERNYTLKRGTSLPQPIASIGLKLTGRSVPFQTDTVINYSFNRPGLYIAVPEFDGMRKGGTKSWNKIFVSDISLSTTGFNKTDVWAVNPMDGKPLEGVEMAIHYDSRRSEQGPYSLGKTNTDGYVSVQEGSGLVTAKFGNDRFAYPVYAYTYSNYTPQTWRTAVEGYSSLPIYHPGDTARWCAVIYEYKFNEHRPCPGKSVQAILTDPSGVELDTLNLTSDRWGRVVGEFHLPSAGLTGNYNIRVDNSWGVVQFMVSDYKLPSFLIDSAKATRGIPVDGDFTISGLIRTYSGFPLAGAKVNIAVSVTQRPRWWMPGQTYKFYDTDTIADNNGRFSIPLTKETIGASPIKNGFYTVTISATSPSGESQVTEVYFTKGERYIIKLNLPENLEIRNGKVPLKAEVVTSTDSLTEIPVRLSVLRPDSTLVLSSFFTDIDLNSVPSGRYIFKFTVPAPYEAEPVTSTTILYRPSDKATPLPGALLWSPDSNVTTHPLGKGEWLFATDCPTHLLVAITTADFLISRRWVEVPAGMGLLPVSIPEGIDNATMTVAATGLFRSTSKTIEIKRGKSERGIRLNLLTFRDRLKPGSRESWTIKVTDLDGKSREAAVVADLYNTALDALSSSSWTFSPARTGGRYFSWNSSPFGSMAWTSAYSVNDKMSECPAEIISDFNTYGYGLVQSPSLRNVMIREYKSAAKSSGTEVIATDEVMDMAGDYEMAGVSLSAADAGGTEESAVEANSEASTITQFKYRQSEVPLAFFHPELTSAPDGTLRLDFELPNANTKWGFRTIAWTDSILTSSLCKDFIAAKHVMVQPNLPRFLRSGDVATLSCLVMNSTDSVMSLTVDIESFNPEDGTVIARQSTDVILAPSGSDTADFTLTAPQQSSFIGYRVKATSSTGDSDGEQTLIPILPVTTEVIETRPFYIAPDSSVFAMDIPPISSEGRLTLQLCENPVWYVVTALPGLIDKEATTSPEAARSLFSAAVAAGLMHDNPMIEQAFHEWENSDKSASTLTSMLERNDELKTVLLNSTPWMTEARSDTERMARLSLLFDRKIISRTISDNISLLAKLYQNGGWAWCSQYPEKSTWATRSVLSLAGYLARLGYLPESKQLRTMLSEALDADTRETVKSFNKHPESDYTSYVILHDLFSSLGIGSPDPSVTDATINRIISGWKHHSLSVKAMDAILLYNHGYKQMAKKLLSSISQFGQSSPEKGLWFPSLGADAVVPTALILEAFSLIEPGCVEVDAIRQWLVLQKGAQDWGSSIATTDVIAVFLHSSTKWIVPAGGCRVELNGDELNISTSDRFIGEYTIPLPTTGGTLNITRQSDTPSWGAIYSQSTDSITSVKSSSCPELSINKQLLLKRANMPPVVVDQSTPLHVGDRITVSLTLHVDIDMDYLVITDSRPAAFELVDQLPGRIYSDGVCFYRENRDSETRIFIDRISRGDYILTYDVWVNNPGTFSSGIATVQSQYAPRFSAHSSGSLIEIFR